MTDNSTIILDDPDTVTISVKEHKQLLAATRSLIELRQLIDKELSRDPFKHVIEKERLRDKLLSYDSSVILRGLSCR